ncbi:hypothetical protein BJX62DRAFT_232681 [Aspergillus germanicus]
MPGLNYIYTTAVASDTMLPWIHPHLAQSVDPIKGRKLQASKRIQKGEVLLLDPPYAIIPTPTPTLDADAEPADSATPILLCSNPLCNRSLPQGTGTRCANRCSTDVIWCNETCHEADKPRHDFECTWLAKYSSRLRTKWGEYNFGMLWLIVRLLARRHAEGQDYNDSNGSSNGTSHTNGTTTDSTTSSSSSSIQTPTFKAGWPAISSLCGTPETWSHAQTREWTVLVKKYLSKASLPHDLPNANVLGLICKEEANSFGLYPRETGVYPPPSVKEEQVGRGEQFGAAVYPRASIANHSCCPNIIHKPDKTARMVFTAGRDIAAGEECCISYFDMTQYVSLSERRAHLSGLFRFKCGCPRCTEEDMNVDGNVEGGEEGMEWGGDGFLGFE